MNDLISRSKMINDIVTYLFSDKCNLNELGEDIREIIDSEPTAYDVDKVVEQIKILSPANYVTKDDVLKIVKGGGVNE